MNKKILFIPLVLFLLLAAALLWQLLRNANGDDPTCLESALIGKPVPVFKLEALDRPGKIYDQKILTDGKGIIRYRHAGDMNARVWQQEVLPLWQKYSKEGA